MKHTNFGNKIRRRELLKLITHSRSLIIYGAGNAGKTLVSWISTQNIDMNKIIIAVSSSIGNPGEIASIPVREISSLLEYRECPVIIATYSETQKQIEQILLGYGFNNIINLDDDQINEFKQEVGNETKRKKQYLKYCERIIKAVYRKRKLKNYIIFESHDDYDGNSGALCNRLIQEGKNKKYKLIWLVQKPEEFSGIKEKNVRFQKIGQYRSFFDIYYLYRAKYMIFDNRILRKKRPDQTSVYLTHGTNPLKDTKQIIVIPDEVDYVLIPAEGLVRIGEQQYNTTKDKFFICGQPRSDDFYDRADDIYKLIPKGKYSKIIAWLPTFRQHCRTTRCDSKMDLKFGVPVVVNDEELKKLDGFLKDNNILLIVKPHPMQNLSYIKIHESENIKVLTNAMMKHNNVSMYGFLAGTDALISDYSNVTFDYLLGDKPIGYARSDDEYMLANESNYDEFMMGPVLKSTEDIINYISNVIEGVDYYKEKRSEVRGKVHTYLDANNSRRVIDFLGL